MLTGTSLRPTWHSALPGGGIVIVYLLFCIHYLAHDRAALAADFLAAGGCFYRQQQFMTVLFTDEVKHMGNILCLAGLPLVLLFAYSLPGYNGFRLLRLSVQRVAADKHSYPWLIALLLICIGLALYGHRYNAMCTDEAFSALNFAEEPVSRLLSYYPLPNNHIFFNLLNHFAALIYPDSVLTGRALSALFYCLLIAANFLLMVRYCRNYWISFLCSVVLALQFLVWGFGHQGRGYALCYLMEWGSFFAFYIYFFRTGTSRKEALTALLCCNIIGTWTVPVFIYLLVFQVVAAVLLVLARRQWYAAFWYTLLLSGVGIFLVYLPVLCYSGIASLAGNGYHPGTSLAATWQASRDYFYDLVTLQTFGFLDTWQPVALCLFIVPGLLGVLFRKQLKAASGLIFLYYMLWLSVAIMVVLMRQFPVMRGIGFQMQVSLLILLLLLARLITTIPGVKRTIACGLLSGVLLLCAARMYQYNKAISPVALYGQDTRSFLNALKALPQDFGPGKDIWLSDESFMWPFILKDRSHIVTHDCNFNNQAILFISEDDRPLPDSVMQHYRERNRAGWFIIYERR